MNRRLFTRRRNPVLRTLHFALNFAWYIQRLNNTPFEAWAKARQPHL